MEILTHFDPFLSNLRKNDASIMRFLAMSWIHTTNHTKVTQKLYKNNANFLLKIFLSIDIVQKDNELKSDNVVEIESNLRQVSKRTTQLIFDTDWTPMSYYRGIKCIIM